MRLVNHRGQSGRIRLWREWKTAVREGGSFLLLTGLGALLICFQSYRRQAVYLVLLAAAAALAVFMSRRHSAVRRACRALAVVSALIFLAGAADTAFHFAVRAWYRDNPAEGAVTAFFDHKKILVVVPHEDDDINLMGDMIRQYREHGSSVTVLFATNGDYYGYGEARLKEAVRALALSGVGEEDIIFLGYGDQWEPAEEPDGTWTGHIYNSRTPGRIWTSHAGRRATYGLKGHPPFEEHAYTRENYVGDMEQIIQRIRPDVIYAVDYDTHPDHRAAGLFLEEALGNILASGDGYYPVLYKGFCYDTSWNARDDFAAVNLRSTVQAEEQDGNPCIIGMYGWENRVRIPAGASEAGRLMSRGRVFAMLDTYRSQQAAVKAGSVINGDKVFWRRRTDSLLYDARISCNGKELAILHDYKLLDSDDVCRKQEVLLDGVWTLPEGVGKICVKIEPGGGKKSREIGTVRLYDSPDPDSNILSGYLLFGDGRTAAFRELEPAGAATVITCPERASGAFLLVIEEWEGERPGLSEIEAYPPGGGQACGEGEIIKLQDSRGNFAYDYWMEEGEWQDFTVYSSKGKETGEYEANLEGEGCRLLKEGGKLSVYCPVGKSCTLRVENDNASDEIAISNPDAVARRFLMYLQAADYRFVTGRDFYSGRFYYYRKIYDRLAWKIGRFNQNKSRQAA